MTPPIDSTDLLLAYLDDDLAPAERADLERRLTRDPALAARLADLRSLYADLATLPDRPAPRDFAAPVVQAIRQSAATVELHLPWLLRAALVLQGALAVLFATFGLISVYVFIPTAPARTWDIITAFFTVEFSTATANWAATLAEWQQLFATAQSTLPALALDPLTLTVLSACLGAGALFWLLANGALLIRADQRALAALRQFTLRR